MEQCLKPLCYFNKHGNGKYKHMNIFQKGHMCRTNFNLQWQHTNHLCFSSNIKCWWIILMHYLLHRLYCQTFITKGYDRIKVHRIKGPHVSNICNTAYWSAAGLFKLTQLHRRKTLHCSICDKNISEATNFDLKCHLKHHAINCL